MVDSTGKQLNTRTFKELSLVLSKGSLLCVPSVLLLLNSADVKKYRRSFSAHLCGVFSFWSISFTAKNFRGVTHELTTSLLTSISKASWLTDCWLWVTVSTEVGVTTGGITDGFKGVVGASGTTVFSSDASTTSLTRAKAAESIVGSSSALWNWKDLKKTRIHKGWFSLGYNEGKRTSAIRWKAIENSHDISIKTLAQDWRTNMFGSSYG